MNVKGVKGTGFSRGRILRDLGVEMASGSETVTRRGPAYEFSVSLTSNAGQQIRLTLTEPEMRDWHMRLTRSLAMIDEKRLA